MLIKKNSTVFSLNIILQTVGSKLKMLDKKRFGKIFPLIVVAIVGLGTLSWC
jgi:hypothetical protein